MFNFKRIWSRAQVLAVVALACAAGAHAAPLDLVQPYDPSGARLLNALATSPNRPAIGREVKRSRPALANTQEILDAKAQAGMPLRLELFPDATFDAVIDSAASGMGGDGFTWSGPLISGATGRFYASMRGGALSAFVMADDGRRFQLRYAGNSVYDILELDPAGEKPCGDTADQAPTGGKGSAAPLKPGSGPRMLDASTQFDLLVVYTPQARIEAGGTAAMQALIANAAAIANDAYANSQINTSMRVVLTQEVGYTESGSLNGDLNHLTNIDGVMDEVQSLRDATGADFVSLLVDANADPAYAGLAWIITTPNPGNPSLAYSVSEASQLIFDVMTHEIGHNMGCQHDYDNGPNPGLFTYSHGYRFTGTDSTLYRTIMAYAPGTRIRYFSNPNILYSGTPAGVSPGQAGEAFNAQSINLAAPAFANYRQAVTQTLSVTPNTTVYAAGAQGGGFTLSASSLTLLNLSGGSLNWTASVADSTVSNGSGGFWHPIDVFPSGGSLSSGLSTPISLSVSSDANQLPVGQYSVLLTVHDTTNGTSVEVPVIVVVLGVDAYQISAIDSPKNAGIAFPISITAQDALDETVSGFSGTVDLSSESFTAPVETTLGSTSAAWDFPLQTIYETARAQCFYASGELGLSAGSVTSLGLYVIALPNPTLLRNWTIRMKHTTYGPEPFQQWEATGWTTVYQGDATFNATGWKTFSFQTPFNYDGLSNVLVDFSYNNSPGEWHSSGLVGSFNNGLYRSIDFQCDNSEGFGPPPAWNGNSNPPYSDSRDAPTLRLTYSPFQAGGGVSPSTTGAFVAGVWNGSISLGSGYDQVRVKATDGAGKTGYSNLFQVLQNLLTAWVDFGWGGSESGAQANPFNTLAEAVSTVQAGGTIIVNAGATAETPRIVKQVRIESTGGTASIGAAP